MSIQDHAVFGYEFAALMELCERNGCAFSYEQENAMVSITRKDRVEPPVVKFDLAGRPLTADALRRAGEYFIAEKGRRNESW
jgi:hypothetical protein